MSTSDTQPAPLLTAEMARWVVVPRRTPAHVDVDAIQDGIEAIRDRRTVNVRVLTEDEHRLAFNNWAYGTDVPTWARPNLWPAYLECARAMGAVR